VPSLCIISPCPSVPCSNQGDKGIHSLLHDSQDCIV
jgi:hypothetical protein